MTSLIKVLVGTLALILGGCVPSLHPFYVDKDVAFDPSVLGTWSDKESKETWEFTKHGERGYKLLYTDDEGRQGRFIVYRFRLAGNTLLDLYPEEPEFQASEVYKNHVLRLHTFALVQHTESKAQLEFLDLDWLQRFLADHPAALQHEMVTDRLILTAPTLELQKFLLIHLKTSGAFSEPEELIRQKT